MTELIGVTKDSLRHAPLIAAVIAAFVGLQYFSDDVVFGIPSLPFAANPFQQVLIVVVVAAIVEEVVFRGIVYHYFKNTLGLPLLVSAASSAALFSLFHWSVYGVGLQAAFVGAFVFGLVSVFLVVRTRSLLSSILAHAAFNAFILASAAVIVG